MATGRLGIEPRKNSFRVPTSRIETEGNTDADVIASLQRTRRGR